MTIEELQENYRRNRLLLEEEEDTIRTFQHKGENMLEQAEERLKQSLSGLDCDNEALMYAKRAYQLAEAQYQDTLATERRQIHQKLDDLEREYHTACRYLTE
ncbi:hypothetical protein CUS80_02050 [Enterococcus faecium]|uniref:hypothetical protein n=1 Tax=Enterococcus TaxID=1350 RepID=UPI000CF3413D|nr:MULTISPECIES: hypothetical protein [Enterococcus]EMF0346944.1 hypothetical protein [Enterococcus faecium]MCU9764024.1 hypothetical protein [Enterococcus faecalis]PQG47487.1 hypothetical protein CUS80_02050 [Enterococcus faecium]